MYFHTSHLCFFSKFAQIFFFLVPVDDKVPEGAEPRFWEEEGFYVGKPPQVSNANLNIMENRIMDANQVWILWIVWGFSLYSVS